MFPPRGAVEGLGLLVDDPAAVGELRLLCPAASLEERPIEHPQRADGDPHVVQKDRVDVVHGQKVELVGPNPGLLHVDDEDGDPGMLGCFRIRPDRGPAVVGVADEARPWLLTVDHVLVSVALGAGAERSEVGAGVGLAVAEAEVALALQDPGQLLLLLLVRAHSHDGGGPTVLIVSIGTGARARMDSSKKMSCPTAERPWPVYSLGQPIPSRPSLPIWRTTERLVAPMPLPRWISSRISSVRGFS